MILSRMFAAALAGLLWVAPSLFAPGFVASAWAADKLRLAIQANGTFGWELAVARAYGLDKAAQLELETTELATTEAGKIALVGGGADIIVSDWLWVARERALGQPLLFSPHSTALGAVMAKEPAKFSRAADLVGKKLGVSGGPLDKSWLLLQAWALKQGVDLKSQASIVYGAPALLAEKLAQGELDAALEFWTFCARLEAKGFGRAVDLIDVEKELGANNPVIVTGYVFTPAFAARQGPALARFLTMMREAKKLIAEDESAFGKIAGMTGLPDAAGQAIVRRYYRAGVPTASIDSEIADAAALYRVLAKLGGPQLVGGDAELDQALFYRAP
jgi:NitT/TauT family transport system substrate-binding protein